MWLRLAMCALLLGTLGCEGGTSGAQSRASRPTSSLGRRVVFEDGAGRPVMKWRVRRALTRVYGEDMAPVGAVRPGDDGGVDLMSRGRVVESRLSREREGTYRLGDALVLEQGPEGWRLYDGQRTPLGRLAGRGEGLALYPPTGQTPTHTVRRQGEWWQVLGAKGEVLVRARHASPEHLISWVLPPGSLGPLERSALAMFWSRVFKEGT